jgi:hypothetical protein
MRRVPWILALILALSAVLPAAALGARPDPKVVVIVGPVGEATDRYLARGEAAAREAERFTPNVVRVFTPNATWPAVKRAIQGASMVIYLGHGNGWPSKYRSSLYPPTQNGFGLNPVAGAGNEAHQYFGEGRIAADVKLAKNAVVLLHHLCYASGNTEPGLPVGTEAEARQRVDNYAAGFIKAGASAVLAEGHIPPAFYVRSILSGKMSIEKIWQSSPSANGNTFTFASKRSSGFTAAMDPDRPGQGFYRSLVVRSGLLPADVAAGATASAAIATGGHADPTLIGSGVTISTPYVKGRLLAGKEATLWIPYTVERRNLPGLTVGVRWDPIDVAEEAPDGAAPDEPAGPAPAVEPASPIASPSESSTPDPSKKPPVNPEKSPTPTATDDLSGDPFAVPETPAPPRSTSSPDPSSDPAAGAPQPPKANDPADARLSLVEPEQVGSVVEPVKVSGGPTRIIVPVTLPTRPGRYRLVATLHDATGVAYDAATQRLLPGLLVRVSGDVGAQYLVGKTATAIAGEPFELRAGVANIGSATWGRQATPGPRLANDALEATLVAHWISLTPGTEAPPADIRFRLPAGLTGGATARATLAGLAPAAPGQYLLVLDVIDPSLGSLAAQGIEPALVRVTVEAAAG